MSGDPSAPAERTLFNRKTVTLLVLAVTGAVLVLWLAVHRFLGVTNHTKSGAAKAQVRMFEDALSRYRLDMERHPTSEEGLRALRNAPDNEEEARKWKGPYLVKDAPKDPWGRDYVYTCPGVHEPTGFDIYSAGEDGLAGTRDDITSWEDE